MAGAFPTALFSQPKNDINFNGGLNTTNGPLSLKDTESPDLQNIDFNKFGSILKRGGYLNLNAYPVYGIGGIDTYTKLCSHFDGADAATAYTDPVAGAYTFVGTAQLSTAQKKFGATSLLLDGNSDYVYLADSANWAFGTGDFTIDCWVNFSDLTGIQTIVAQWANANNQWALFKQADHTLRMYFYIGGVCKGSYVMSSPWAGLTTATWYHLAFERNSTIAKIFINGVSQTLTEATAFSTNDVGDVSAVLCIGSTLGSPYFNGYIDELRISKGIARWTTDFTPPLAPYSVPATSTNSDGLMWYEYVSSGSYASRFLESTNGAMYAMTGLNGTWTDITGSATITAGNFFSSTNWNNKIYMTNGKNSPLQWTGTSNVSTLPALQANSYTFTVYSITTAPAVGDTYTNNTVTYTITNVNVSGAAGAIAGTICATGSGAPSTYGVLTRATGSGDTTINFSMEVLNVNITSAQFITQWNNYLFLANVNINNGTYLPTRIYWCNVRDDTSWTATNWIEISMQDGQPITGMYALSDRLVIFKQRSIYNMFFTGDSALPFVYLVSNSPKVGCMAPYSIQEIENGIVFLSYDGFYYYDGNNSYKMSLQIQPTIDSLNKTKLYGARSLKQQNKNKYMCSVPSSSSNTNDTVITWDWVLNAFSIYSGMAPSAMKTVYVSGTQEQIYFADYSGYTYQMDTGVNDYPLTVQTAINSYYWTNWKSFGDAMMQKANPNVVIYYESNNSILTFGYSYDFDTGVDYQNSFSMATETSVYGSAVYGSATYAGTGGQYKRQDLDGRGRVMRFLFANSNLSEQMQIDGLASFVNAETVE